MTAHAATPQSHFEGSRRETHAAAPAALRYLVPLGRLLFSAIFLSTALSHFSSDTIARAAQSGVPAAGVLVPISGVMATLGGLSVLLGYKARIGALLLIAFLVPVTLSMHAFWSVADGAMAKIQQIMFMKNVSMVGAALMIAYFGAGPVSVDEGRG